MKNLLCLLVLFIATSSFSEFRIWRDQKGNSVEAELVTLNATMVVIKDRDGKTFKFAPSKLSIEDQKYLKNAIPPRMDIEFKKVMDRVNTSHNYSARVTLECEVTVTKKEQRAFDKDLKVTLMVFGESQRYRDIIVMDKTEASFSFRSSREFTMNAGLISMYQDKYDNSSGVKYEGYLAVVQDKSGKVLLVKSSRKSFEDEVAALLKFNKKDRFSKELRKSPVENHYIYDGSTLYN